MRILVTNDDGIAAPGIAALAGALAGDGHDVVVVAPKHDMSGMAAALGPFGRAGHGAVDRADLGDVEGWSVDGPPAYGVFAAVKGAFGPPPDVVVSGINAGANCGRAVVHSGTVGAALTAAIDGVPALAVSLDVGDGWQWDTAAAVALESLAWLARHPEPGTVLNVNVPNRPLEDVRGFRWAELAVFGLVEAAGTHPDRGLVFELSAADPPCAPDSDQALMRAGFVTATLLAGITAVDHSPFAALPDPGDIRLNPRPGEG